MVEIEIPLTEDTYAALKQAAQEKHKTETELAVEAIQVYLESLSRIDPLVGLFANDVELIDSITEDAMRAREATPLRLTRS